MNESELKTVDVEALEWFDKANGNSYFAAIVTLNYGMDNQETIRLPFQYGYGMAFEYEAIKAICENLAITCNNSLYSWCKNRGIILRSRKDKATKRELKAI